MNAEAKTLPKPVDWDELYPGRFLKSGDFKGKHVTLTMSDVKIEELVGDKGPQIKGVISFKETDKQLALNKTNGLCLKAMFGRLVQEWVGKRVTLFPSQWNGEQCIRIHGSPDIEQDTVVSVALPRRRPFDMTMHKTVAKGAAKKPVASAGAEADLGAKLEKMLRAASDLTALEAAWTTATTLLAGMQIPIPVQAAYDEMREHLAN